MTTRWFTHCLSAGCLVVLSIAIAPSAADEHDAPWGNLVNGTTITVLKISPKAGRFSIADDSPDDDSPDDQETDNPLDAFFKRANTLLDQTEKQMHGESVYFGVDQLRKFFTPARLSASSKTTGAQWLSAIDASWLRKAGSSKVDGPWRTVPLAIEAPPHFKTEQYETPSTELVAVDLARWQAAADATAEFPLQTLVVLPNYLRETFAELQPELPESLGGGDASVLVAGVDWISWGVAPDQSSMRLIVQATSPDVALAIKERLPSLLTGIMNAAIRDPNGTSETASAVIAILEPSLRVVGSQLVLSFSNADDAVSLLRLTEAALAITSPHLASQKTRDHLKELIIAFHNYHDAHASLPAYRDMKKDAGLSWRVHVLPFIGETKLYQQFKLDQPWDSAHNIKLLERMPNVYRPQLILGTHERAKPYHTTIVAPTGEGTIMGQDKPVGFRDVTDGTSNTITLVEVDLEHAVAWTSPNDYAFDPNDPTAHLRQTVAGLTNIALLDGSVHAVPIDLAPKTWLRLFTRNDGNSVSLNKPKQ